MIEPQPIIHDPADALPSVVAARTRARVNWDADGISTAILGICWAIIGAGGLLARTVTSFEFLGDCASLLGSFVLVEESAVGKIASWAKGRTTFSRTGYVAFPSSVELQRSAELPASVEKDQIRREILPFLVPIGFFLLSTIMQRHWPFAVGTAVLSLLLWYQRAAGELLWPRLVAVVVFGSIATLLPFSVKPRLNIALIASGILLIVFGAIIFSRYVKQHPLSRT